MRDNLIPRSNKASKVAIKNIEIKLIKTDVNKFILRLGNNVTFVEEIRLDL